MTEALTNLLAQEVRNFAVVGQANLVECGGKVRLESFSPEWLHRMARELSPKEDLDFWTNRFLKEAFVRIAKGSTGQISFAAPKDLEALFDWLASAPEHTAKCVEEARDTSKRESFLNEVAGGMALAKRLVFEKAIEMLEGMAKGKLIMDGRATIEDLVEEKR